MAIFDGVGPFEFQKFATAARDLFSKRASDNRPEAVPRKGMFRFLNTMMNKKQQRVFTFNSATLKRLANTDPITWAIRRTIKSYVNQAEWDIVVDIEDEERELNRYEDYVISHLSPYASGELMEFRSDIIDSKLIKEIKVAIKKIFDEDWTTPAKKKAIAWYFSSFSTPSNASSNSVGSSN